MTLPRRSRTRISAAGAIVALSLAVAPVTATAAPSPTPIPKTTATLEPTATPTSTPAPTPTGNPSPTGSPSPTAAPTPAPEIPVPEGQSGQPAPASREKRVVDEEHTDTVSSFLDDGELVLESKADVDVTGDGIPDPGSRFNPDEVLFHLKDSARLTVPDQPEFAFLGDPGSTVWLAPEVQQPGLIWPGFSTEDPNLQGQVQGRLSVRMTNVEGPGELEMFLSGPRRTYSSQKELPPWSLAVPQHEHQNWSFTAPGTYTLTFEMSGTVAGRAQTASNEYVFVVGDLAAHTRDTVTRLSASAGEIDPGEPVLLTAEVAADAVGAVQFRDLSTGSILGHTPVGAGTASFRAAALTPGEHRIVAEFVPTWSNDFTASASHALTIDVSGDVLPKPTEVDTTPVPEPELAVHAPGTDLVVTSTGKTVAAGAALSARVTEEAFAGQWVSVWIPGDTPAWKGWVQADLDGEFTVVVGGSVSAGDHRLVVKNRLGGLIGWDAFRVTTPATGGPNPGAPPPPPVQPPPPAQSAPQTCQPALTLETGHIDAFYVSAANGRAVLQLMEDVTGHRVIREPEQTLLRVKPSAYRSNIPGGTPGAPAGFVLPLTQDPSLIWPGWDTNRTAASGHSDVSITVAGVDGPGRVYLSSQGSFGGVTSLLNGGGYTLPGTIREEVPAHTHAQWVFSEAGIYRLSVYAVATNPSNGDSLRTATRSYTFQVGDVPLGDAFCGLSPVGMADSAAVNAAVNRAAADAVAAAQLDAEAAAAAEAEARERAERAAREREDDEDGAADAAAPVSAISTPVLLGIIGGGALVVAGIVGATIWYVRRLGSPTPPGPGTP